MGWLQPGLGHLFEGINIYILLPLHYVFNTRHTKVMPLVLRAVLLLNTVVVCVLGQGVPAYDHHDVLVTVPTQSMAEMQALTRNIEGVTKYTCRYFTTWGSVCTSRTD